MHRLSVEFSLCRLQLDVGTFRGKGEVRTECRDGMEVGSMVCKDTRLRNQGFGTTVISVTPKEFGV